MANTYTQLSIHGVFAVAHRENIIVAPWRDRLHQYLAGILASETNYALAVGGWKDHVHVFFEMHPTQSVSKVMQVIKSKSSGWINDNKLVQGHFNWQEGYGAFAHARSQRHQVIQYIMHQEEHHQHTTFKEEYIGILEAHELAFDDRYLFDFFE